MTLFKGTGAQILVKSLAIHGVKRASSVAGESYLAVLDALLDYPEIQMITCRQEGGAAFMAESWGKMTGEPGICFVTRGPGVCNASIGVHTAMQDSSPMILFMGQVRREENGREAFQEVNVRQVFGGLAKWATEIEDPARIPEIVYRAFKTATAGRPGPVVIGLPEDMLRQVTEAELTAPYKIVTPHASAKDLNDLQALLTKAQRPLVLVGGAGWSDATCAQFIKFAESAGLPVMTSFRRQDIFDHRHACYVGELGTGPNPKLLEKVKESDLILCVGARLDEIAMQSYTLLDAPNPKQTLIHVHPSADEIGKVYVPALAIQAGMDSFAAALSSVKIDGSKWKSWHDELRTIYNAWTAIGPDKLHKWDGADMTAIFAFLRDALPKDAIITTDAGNFSGWAQRYLQYGRPGRLLAPISGAMGYN
ncbi:MAG TPA: thiamine pyrophosphate-binding protein, partial [Alphaproteobacteria bacterium]